MKKTIRMIAVSAVLWFGVGTANAIDSNVGNLTPTVPISLIGAPAFGPPSFTDRIQFNLIGTGIGGSAVTLPLVLNAAQLIGINPLDLKLYAGVNGDNSGGIIQTFSQVSQGTSFAFNQPLAAGTYHFDIVGTVTGSGGGIYNVAIAAVPEPETYAMLLVGLGLIGFAARRRKNNFN